MCARMGVVTGKGLSDLIREEFGFRPDVFRHGRRLFRGSRQRGRRIRRRGLGHGAFRRQQLHFRAARRATVWVLVLQGTYRQVEKIFLVSCAFYLSYFFSAILAKPDWLEAARHTVIPRSSSIPAIC